MSKNTIKIDGEKLRALLESSTGKNLYQIAEENGFSRNIITEAIRNKKASPIIQNIAKLYGIAPEDYKAKDPEIKEATQITIDDIETIKREELKALMKDVLFDIFYNSEILIENDPIKGNRLFLRDRRA